MPTILEDEAEVARRAKTPTGKEPLLEEYPGLEPAILPTEALFKFKGQDPLLRGDSSAGNIRAVPGADAMSEIAVYNMAQQEMTFRDAPLNAAVSIAPRSRLGRTGSSTGPGEADRQLQSESFDFADGGRAYSSIERTRSSLDRTRSSLERTRSSFSYADPAARSLMERTGSSIAQYDAQVCHKMLNWGSGLCIAKNLLLLFCISFQQMFEFVLRTAFKHTSFAVQATARLMHSCVASNTHKAALQPSRWYFTNFLNIPTHTIQSSPFIL